MDKVTRALVLYNPIKSRNAYLRFKTFVNNKLIGLSLKYRKELFLFVCLYIVFEFFGYCFSTKDRSILNGFDFLEFKNVFLILCCNAVFGFTVFGRIVSSATVSFFGLCFGIEFYATEFATQGGKFGSIPNIIVILALSFMILLYLLETFCFSRKADFGKRELFQRKSLIVHILFICISIILIYFLFYLYYNV